MNLHKTVLIVDDDPKTCMILSRIISSQENFSILTASCGNDAINILKDIGKHINLVITDMYMPEGTGIDVITYIRAQNLKVDIVLVSGGDKGFYGNIPIKEDKFLETAIKFGQVKFLKKPFNREDVLELVNGPLKKTA